MNFAAYKGRGDFSSLLQCNKLVVCRRGYDVVLLAQHGAKVNGLDLSPDGVGCLAAVETQKLKFKLEAE